VPQVPGVMPREYADAERFADKDALKNGKFEEAKARAESSDRAARFRSAEAEKRDGMPMLRSNLSAGKPAAPAAMPAEPPLSPDDLVQYGAAAQAQAGEIGEVFQYQMKTPVSIPRQRSAMLPILSSGIEGRRVSIYNRADGSEHPMRGVEIKNTSGLQLMPGPISVFDGAAYAGDAQIGHVTLNDKRLLAYAVDLDVQAVVKAEDNAVVRSVKIVNGQIEETVKRQAKVSYAFGNKDEKRPRTVIVEQPKVKGWDLVEPKKASEETESLYRFELPLAAKESGKVDVLQERTDLQRYAVTSYDSGTLLAYFKDGKVSQKVVDAVKKAADMQAAINATTQRISQLDAEKQSIDQDQARIRQNMGSVSRDTELYKRYMTKLNEQETRLEKIREDREMEVGTLNRQQAELQGYVAGLNVG
jgi:hypothetical protein